jgi:hypothetical protein
MVVHMIGSSYYKQFDAVFLWLTHVHSALKLLYRIACLLCGLKLHAYCPNIFESIKQVMTFDMYLPHTLPQQDAQDAAAASSSATTTSTNSASATSSSRPSSFRRTSFSSSAAASAAAAATAAAAAAATQHATALNIVSADVDTLHSPGIHILKALVVEKCQEGCNPVKRSVANLLQYLALSYLNVFQYK